MPNSINVLFFGADLFGAPVLKSLLNNPKVKIVALVTRSPKPAGRGLKPSPNPMITLARSHRALIVFAENLDDWDKIERLMKKDKPEYAIVAGFGKLIPADILGLMPNRFINIHPSLLPKYRGPSPIETAILNGDKETGLSFIVLDNKMDAGPIIYQEKITIGSANAPRVNEIISNRAAGLIWEIVDNYHLGKLSPQNQNERQATYTHVLTKQDGLIRSSDSANVINSKYRALAGWPGIYFQVGGRNFKIIDGAKRGGYFHVSKVQPESKSVISAKDFANGYRDILTKVPKFVRITKSTDIEKGKK